VLNRPSIAVRRVALPLLAALLLLLQALGLVHAVMHGPGHAFHAAAAAAHDASGDLFGAHDDEASCRLYDQLAHADAACGVPVLALRDTVQVCVDVILRSGRHAPQAAGFLARGPPFTA
jgi:hypothetical protein